MNYENVCKILEELMVELMEKGIQIPPHLTDDLNTGRSFVRICEASPSDPEAGLQATLYVQRTEAGLLYLADSQVGKDYADGWQNKIGAAYALSGEKAAPKPTFVSGIPKGEHWVRLKISEMPDEKELSDLLMTLGLSYKPQEDGYLLVHGKKEDITYLLKELRQKFGKS